MHKTFSSLSASHQANTSKVSALLATMYFPILRQLSTKCHRRLWLYLFPAGSTCCIACYDHRCFLVTKHSSMRDITLLGKMFTSGRCQASLLSSQQGKNFGQENCCFAVCVSSYNWLILNVQGGRQLACDAQTLFSVFQPYTYKASAHFKELRDASLLLSLEPETLHELKVSLHSMSKSDSKQRLKQLGVLKLTPDEALGIMDQRL